MITSAVPMLCYLQKVCCVSATIPDRVVDGAAVEGEQRELQKVMNEIIVGGHYWGCSACAALGLSGHNFCIEKLNGRDFLYACA